MMTVKRFVIFLIIWSTSIPLSVSAQSYYSLKEAKAIPPDSVFYLSLSRNKLTEIPSEIFIYTNLIGLDLSKNRFGAINPSILGFRNLEILNLSKNRFEVFPKLLFKLENLRELRLGSNDLTYIPNSIYICPKLEVLDMYNNPISTLGTGLNRSKSLIELDLRGLMYNSKKQSEIRDMLRGVEVLFDAPCNCTD